MKMSKINKETTNQQQLPPDQVKNLPTSMPALPVKMPPLPFKKKVEGEKEKDESRVAPPEYLQGSKPWRIPDSELPVDYKSRWESGKTRGWAPVEPDKGFTAQCFSFLPAHKYSLNEIEILIRKHRIDDLTKRLILQDFEQQNDPDLRSPSPEPIYDTKTGLRTNTRDQRLKDKYVKERYRLITEVIQMDPGFVPPSDYKPPKKHKKIYIPEADDPFINYIGQIIGPGGQTQKKLEKESHCKIQIRGEGSQNKAGLSAANAAKQYERDLLDGGQADDTEPLHVYLTANTEEQIEVGSAMINAILQQTEEARKYAIVTYDHAATRRVWCENCGKQGHKFFQCPEKIQGIKSNIMCQHCSSTNHLSSDCPQRYSHRQNALGGIDPKSQLALTELTAEEELQRFLEEVQKGKEKKDQLKSITFDQIAQNAGKSYEE